MIRSPNLIHYSLLIVLLLLHNNRQLGGGNLLRPRPLKAQFPRDLALGALARVAYRARRCCALSRLPMRPLDVDVAPLRVVLRGIVISPLEYLTLDIQIEIQFPATLHI